MLCLTALLALAFGACTSDNPVQKDGAVKDLPTSKDGVTDGVVDDARSEAGRGLRRVPGSLAEALDALEADHGFLLRDGVFSEDLIARWIAFKREKEVKFVSLRPHPGEFSLYFDA